MDSIMQRDKRCIVTGYIAPLHRHHIFGGSRRKASEKWGCWCWLRSDWHNLADYGVHFNKDLDATIKQDCQKKFEELYGHEKFMEVFGKNYLED